jgi:hypothetical protein
LSYDEVFHSVPVQVCSDHGTTIPITIRSREVRDIGKSTVPQIQKRAISLVGTQVVLIGDDLPGITHPELTRGPVQLPQGRQIRQAVERLRHGSLPNA